MEASVPPPSHLPHPLHLCILSATPPRALQRRLLPPVDTPMTRTTAVTTRVSAAITPCLNPWEGPNRAPRCHSCPISSVIIYFPHRVRGGLLNKAGHTTILLKPYKSFLYSLEWNSTCFPRPLSLHATRGPATLQISCPSTCHFLQVAAVSPTSLLFLEHCSCHRAPSIVFLSGHSQGLTCTNSGFCSNTSGSDKKALFWHPMWLKLHWNLALLHYFIHFCVDSLSLSLLKHNLRKNWDLLILL